MQGINTTTLRQMKRVMIQLRCRTCREKRNAIKENHSVKGINAPKENKGRLVLKASLP